MGKLTHRFMNALSKAIKLHEPILENPTKSNQFFQKISQTMFFMDSLGFYYFLFMFTKWLSQ